MANDGSGIGASLLRKEDERHLHGRGEFVSDIKLPDTMEVAFVRTPHAHARIRSISVPLEARGRVFTTADLPRIKPIRITVHATGAKAPVWPPLATDKVRYVGEAIAACIAPTRGEA
jgi:aerobic carbon-monoxide dehydrogenase large subunit